MAQNAHSAVHSTKKLGLASITAKAVTCHFIVQLRNTIAALAGRAFGPHCLTRLVRSQTTRCLPRAPKCIAAAVGPIWVISLMMGRNLRANVIVLTASALPSRPKISTGPFASCDLTNRWRYLAGRHRKLCSLFWHGSNLESSTRIRCAWPTRCVVLAKTGFNEAKHCQFVWPVPVNEYRPLNHDG